MRVHFCVRGTGRWLSEELLRDTQLRNKPAGKSVHAHVLVCERIECKYVVHGESINPHIITHIDLLSISLLPLLTLLEYNVGVPMCVCGWV